MLDISADWPRSAITVKVLGWPFLRHALELCIPSSPSLKGWPVSVSLAYFGKCDKSLSMPLHNGLSLHTAIFMPSSTIQWVIGCSRS